jgi:hypothetical protein
MVLIIFVRKQTTILNLFWLDATTQKLEMNYEDMQEDYVYFFAEN